jgi:hypothetical protein
MDRSIIWLRRRNGGGIGWERNNNPSRAVRAGFLRSPQLIALPAEPIPLPIPDPYPESPIPDPAAVSA